MISKKWLVPVPLVVIFGLLFQNCGTGFVNQGPLDGNFGATLSSLTADPSYVYKFTNGSLAYYKNPIFSDTSSVVLAVNPQATGILHRFYAEPGVEEARLAYDSGKLLIYHITNGANFSYAEVPLTISQRLVVAASFSKGSKGLRLFINGRPQTLNIINMGAPINFSYLYKAAPEGDGSGHLLSKLVYSTALSDYELSVISSSMALEFNISNVQHNPTLSQIRPGSADYLTPQFLAAKAILDAKCLSCHNTASNGDFRNLTETQFIQKGLVSARNPAGSKIYFRLQGAKAGPGPKNMPPTAPLSDAEVNTIEAWITAIEL